MQPTIYFVLPGAISTTDESGRTAMVFPSEYAAEITEQRLQLAKCAEFEACQAAERRVEVLEGLLRSLRTNANTELFSDGQLAAVDAALNKNAES